ncbi:MAG TPA: efflux RND transporter periplasmic adaptor subunit [Gammaproteobacteria bacterium]|nr:efflux RND transporter periplasmic adaptor subunit [Gammaproteobacteria bacterium]
MNKILMSLLFLSLAAACGRGPPGAEDAQGDVATAEAARGPNGGRLLVDGDFTLELAIFEAGVPPEFHAWATAGGRALAPADVALTVELARLGGTMDRIEFAPQNEFLRGTAVVYEPHSFDVTVIAQHAGREHRFEYESYEGRTTIAADVARAAGIETAVAGPGSISDELVLYGAIVPDATRVRAVHARFPGVIRSVGRNVGDTVRAGETLATIESNESLQTYAVAAPIGGLVTARHAAAGEQTDAEPLFTIVDFSSVWAELDVFSRDRSRLAVGLPVSIAADGAAAAEDSIDYIVPVGNRASQSVTARVVLDNADGRFTPGQFVEGRVAIATTPVALAVPLSALQRFRDFDVVFAQVGEDYEVRMLDLGRRDGRYVEILGGLAPGTAYVTEQSYLIKADIEKAGASHDH